MKKFHLFISSTFCVFQVTFVQEPDELSMFYNLKRACCCSIASSANVVVCPTNLGLRGFVCRNPLNCEPYFAALHVLLPSHNIKDFKEK